MFTLCLHKVVRGCAHRARSYVLVYAHEGEEAAKKEFIDIERQAHLDEGIQSAQRPGDHHPSWSRESTSNRDSGRVTNLLNRRDQQAWIAASKPALVQPGPIVDEITRFMGSPRSPCFD
jgi:hypothetical protein